MDEIKRDPEELIVLAVMSSLLFSPFNLSFSYLGVEEDHFLFIALARETVYGYYLLK